MERAKAIQQSRVGAPEYHYKELIKKAAKSREPRRIGIDEEMFNLYIGYRFYIYGNTAFEIRAGEIFENLEGNPRLVYKSYWLEMISKMVLTPELDCQSNPGYYSFFEISQSELNYNDFAELDEENQSIAVAMSQMFDKIVEDVNIDHCLFNYKPNHDSSVDYRKEIDELLDECCQPS